MYNFLSAVLINSKQQFLCFSLVSQLDLQHGFHDSKSCLHLPAGVYFVMTCMCAHVSTQ